MACLNCGSDWRGSAADCSSCPHCDKRKRFIAKRAGLWVDPTMVKQCTACGQDFTAVGMFAIKQRELCGRHECKRSIARNRMRNWWQRKRDGGPVKQIGRRDRGTCVRCGKNLGPCQAKYCSRECSFGDVRDGNRQHGRRPLNDRVAEDIGAWFLSWERQRPKWKGKCESCGKKHETKGVGRFCSRECAIAWKGLRGCPCGTTVDDASSLGPVRCEACRLRAKRNGRRKRNRIVGVSYRKRCRRYGGYFNPKCKRLAILERDGFRCHICKRQCKKSGKHSDVRVATVDHHPVPLSRGGDHDWHNVRCACMGCNSRKMANWNGQRLLSFGFPQATG